MAGNPPVLDYGRPTGRPNWVGTVTTAIVRYVLVASVLFALALPLLLIQGTWYFWDQPRWMLDVRYGMGGTYVGPATSPWVIPDGLTLFTEMSLVAVPAWAVRRLKSSDK